MLPAADGVADRDDFPDEIIQVHAAGQEAGRVAGGVAVVPVQRNIVNVLVALVQHLVFPAAESRHLMGAAAAGHDFNVRIHPFHHLGGFVGCPAVFIGGLLAHLPGAVHFVSEAPEFDVEGVLRPVFDAQVAPVAAAFMVAVFHHIPRGVRPPGAEVHGVHDFRVRLLRPFAEFVQAHLVGLRGAPGQVQPLRPLIPRADGIFPVEPGNKVAARIANHRDAEFPYLPDHVPPETVFVRGGMAGLINPTVHRPAQVLDKGTVHSGIDFADGKVLIQNHFCFLHENFNPLSSFERCRAAPILPILLSLGNGKTSRLTQKNGRSRCCSRSPKNPRRQFSP